MLSITISIPDFKTVIRDAVKEELENFKKQLAAKKDDNLLTRKEAAMLLKIDLSTLHIWTRDKKLHTHKIGRRIYYKRDENQLLS